jgi:hypothetical protein
MIFQLEQDEGTIVGEANLEVVIMEHYKKLFGPPLSSNFSVAENLKSDILTAEFTGEEVKEAIMQMEKIKLLDQMGFLQSFINKL